METISTIKKKSPLTTPSPSNKFKKSCRATFKKNNHIFVSLWNKHPKKRSRQSMKLYLFTTPLLVPASGVSRSVMGKSSDYGRERIKTMSWDGIDVVWLQDERFPTYSIQIYFADGALKRRKKWRTRQRNFRPSSSGNPPLQSKTNFRQLGIFWRFPRRQCLPRKFHLPNQRNHQACHPHHDENLPPLQRCPLSCQRTE